MPDFPRYQSKAVPTTQTPSVGAVESTEGQILEQTAKVAAGVQDTASKLTTALNASRKAVALANHKVKLADIEARMSVDPDPNNLNSYLQEIKQSESAASKGLSKSDAAELSLESQLSSIKLGSDSKKKTLELGDVATQRLIDLEKNNPDENSLKRIEKYVRDNPNLGFERDGEFILTEKGNKILESGKDAVRQNLFIRDLRINPDFAEDNLNRNTYGFDLDKLEKARSIKSNMAKKDEEDRKNSQMDATNQAGELLAKRELTSEQIQDWVTSGIMGADMALNFELATAGPDKWRDFASKEEQGAKSKIMTDLLEKINSDDVQKRIEIVKSALQNYNDKAINGDDLAFVLRVANGKSKDPQNPIWGFLKAGFSSIGETMGKKAADGVVEKFKNRWDFKEDPRQVIKQAAIDQFKEDKPETASYKIGDEITRHGRKGKIVDFDSDGTPIVEVK